VAKISEEEENNQCNRKQKAFIESLKAKKLNVQVSEFLHFLDVV